MASLSTSASMISPLNPLPSPWPTISNQSSPFSPPTSLSSDTSSVTSLSPAGVAMRLNRVPTSVRLAADLIRIPSGSSTLQSGGSPPSSGSADSLVSIPTPNPSLAGSEPDTKHVLSLLPRDMGPPLSMPSPSAHPPTSTDPRRGRQSLSVPGTPYAAQSISPTGSEPPAIVGPVVITERSQPAALATLAPPSAFKVPLAPVLSRDRPSLPSDRLDSAEFIGGGSRHRNRVSLHEAAFKPTLLSDFTESPHEEWSSIQENPASTSATSSRGTAHGLGLKIPPVSAQSTTFPGAGNVTLDAYAHPPRLRSTTGKDLQMDIAGVSSLGDAASHASMIMQSRQAKLQRWRPSSSGTQVSPALRAHDID